MDTKFFFGATLFSRLENDVQSYCLEDYSKWSFFNNSKMEFTEDLQVNCSRIEEVCCHKVAISSTNSANASYYTEENSKTLGSYTAIGTQHGRYLYQKDGEDRFLEYGDRYWIVSTGVGKTSGHLNHLGGSVCPESIKSGWQISTQDPQGNWGWMADPGVRLSCVAEPSESPPASHYQLRHLPHTVAEEHLPHHAKVRHLTTNHEGHSTREVASSTILGLILLFLLLAMAAFFTKRFHKAWGRGAHGKQLLAETFVD